MADIVRVQISQIFAQRVERLLNRLHRSLFVVILASFLIPAFGLESRANSLETIQTKIARYLKRPGVRSASWGIQVLDPETSSVLLEVNPDKPFLPASVLKVVTTSAAIEDNLIKPDQMFYAEEGTYRVAGRQHPIKDTHEYGWISFKEAMALSSNIVMAKASDIIGPERFYRMARNYGFGIQTNIELPGEVRKKIQKIVEGG